MTSTPAPDERDEGVGSKTYFERLEAELKQAAQAHMAREAVSGSFSATDLLNECYLRLAKGGASQWPSRQAFQAAAAVSMRRILVERARRRQAKKYGGSWRRVPLAGADPAAPIDSPEVVELDEALTRLERSQPAYARLVTLRFFGGLTIVEAAAELGVSAANAKRQWRAARAWLLKELKGDE